MRGPATANVAVTKAVTPTNPFTGDTVTYTIIANNSGAIDDTNVVLTDDLPADVAFASWVDQPAGATESGGTISWSGALSVSESITFTFVVTNNAAGNTVVTNTVMASGTSNMDTADAAFTTASLTGDITFVYYDLEDVVQTGDLIFLAGNFNGFDNTALSMTANADNSVFTATVPNLSGTLVYKYVVDNGGKEWEWLNTSDRTYEVAGTATIENYRHITSGYANLNTSDEITVSMNMATGQILGEAYYENVTNPAGPARGLVAEVGYGTDSDLSNWTWMPADFNQQNGDNDEYGGVLTPTVPGTYSYTVRFNGNSGMGNPNSEWVYADSTGVGPFPGGEFSLSDLGVLNVTFDSVPIATARAGSNGETFAVEGTVTYVPGTFAFAGWALQDASGGIAVFDGGFVPTIDYGDQVRMVGVRGQFSGEIQFNDILFFENLGAGPEVTPVVTDTAVVDTGSLDGVIVTVQGLTEGLSNCNDNNFAINDGSGAINIFIDSDTNINLCAESIDGNGIEVNLTGFATNFNGTNQIKPRRQSDVFGIFDRPTVLNTDPGNGATNVATDTSVDITFNEPVTATGTWFDFACSLSGNVATTADSGTATTFTITPTANLLDGDICNVTVKADAISDADGNNMLNDYPFSFTVGTATFGACGDPATLISFVQGDGFVSPIVGSDIVVEAVISYRYDSLSGFYLQEEAADSDNNPATSEGVFVYDPNNTITATVGSVVRVAATVSEFNGMTQLVNDTDRTVCGTDTLAPTIVTLPLANATDWEQVEGMWVSIEDELTVTDNFRLGRFGQVRLSVGGRLAQPTNVVAPGTAANDLQNLNNRSFITLDDALPFQNPDPVVYPEPELSFTNTLRGGDTLPNGIVGIIDEYNNDSADDYRLYPTGAVDFVESNPRESDAPAVGGRIQVASFNVLNYFTTFGSRGAEDQFEFDRQRDKIINAIVEMDAEIVGLMEIENNTAAIQNLVDGLNAATTAGTYAYIDTGIVGTDQIKVALIYKPALVTPVGNYVILDSSVDPDFDDSKNRPVVIQTFEENSTGEKVTVAVNHLKSKGSACTDVGDPDMGDGQGNCNGVRTEAAQALADYLATDPTGSGSDNFLIIGDLNSYAMEDPIVALQDAGYTNLILAFNGADAYGYTFEGQWGYLDHALASAGLVDEVTGVSDWHINADEPIVLDYNTNFKTPNQIDIFYSPEPFRASDHDPVLIGLDLETVTQPTSVTLTLLHNNDGESSLLPTTNTVDELELIVGGVDAFKSVVDAQVADAANKGNALVNVYAGDAFLASAALQCTLPPTNGPFYDALAQTKLPYTAHILGNHEFDYGPEFL
ncbi:MAG: ExeM/NucH family extracellular endonuclease, partial [Anaerolineales bacterium]|nr:ExeM/NucH family extracellular endonuclease [Anaerolineales bacterium]